MMPNCGHKPPKVTSITDKQNITDALSKREWGHFPQWKDFTKWALRAYIVYGRV